MLHIAFGSPKKPLLPARYAWLAIAGLSRSMSLCLLALAIPLAVVADDRVVLQLKWRHAYQFAGYYAARALGYYQADGLDVEFREGGPDIDPVKEVEFGRATYAVSGVDILKAHSQGKPIVAIGVIFQHSADALIVRDADNIDALSELIGRKVMLSPGTPGIELMLVKALGSLDFVTIVKHDGDFSRLIDRRVDALSAYYTDEPHFYHRLSFPVKMFRPVDYGLDFYGDVLFTASREVSLHRQRLDKFWQASLRGWEFAMHHPEKMLPIIRQYNDQLSDDHLVAEYRMMLEAVQPHYVPLGNMSLQRWRDISENLKTIGQLPQNYDMKGLLYEPNLTLPDHEDYRPLLIANGIIAAVFAAVIVYLILINRRMKEAMKKRRQAEDNAAQLGDILERSLNEIYIFDADTLRFINVNEGARRNLGYSLQELMQMTPLDIKHDCTEAMFLTEIINPMRCQQINSKILMTRHFRKDGSCYPVEVHLQRGHYREQAVFIALVVDISERIAAQALYQREKALLRALIDSIPDLIFFKDKQSVYLGCNKAFERYFGAEEKDIIGKTDFDFTSPELADVYRRQDQETLSNGKSSENEEWRHYPDGRRVLLDTLKTPYYGPDGEILGVIGISRDITAMREMETARHVALQRFEAIFENAPQVAIQGFWRDGSIRHWNLANQTIYGYAAEQAIGQKIQELLVAPDKRQSFLREIEAVWDGDLVVRGKEWCGRHREGHDVWVYRGMFPIVEDGQVSEIFCMDVEINELKHVELELRELNEELEHCVEREVEISRQKDIALIHQARFAALGEMIGNIAHQWRQPLNSLSLLMANLRETCRGCDSNADVLQYTYAESQRLIRTMSQTITDFSNFFKSGREEYPFNPIDGVGQAVNMMKPALDHAEIALEIQGEISARVHGIYNEFVQMVMNLMTNAKDAILAHRPSGGRIAIVLSESGNYVVLTVRDNGGGISEQIVEKIFDPYFTTKPQGTGIGLSMVRMLVERANGNIVCHSDEEGAVFTVSLPKYIDNNAGEARL